MLSIKPQVLLESFSKYKFAERLLRQSYLAFCAAERDVYDQSRIARVFNGEIVSESESDSPEAYVELTEPLSTIGKEMITKKRKKIQRRARRRKEKAIAEQRFLSCKVSKRANTIIEKFPDIGETIENFVQEICWHRKGHK